MEACTRLHIAICEDADDDAGRLQKLIAASGIAAEVRRFASGEDFLASFQAGMFDLVFMDIYMTGMRGIETVAAIRETDETVMIAFATGSSDHALESYKLDVLRYLVKPVTAGKLRKTLELALWQKKSRPSIPVTLAGGHGAEIFLDSIVYFEHKNHVVELHTTKQLLVTSQSARLDKFEKLLPSPPFLRCHRSFLVNLDYVERADRGINAFLMKNGHRADIRQGSFAKCRTALQNWRLAKAGRRGE